MQDCLSFERLQQGNHVYVPKLLITDLWIYAEICISQGLYSRAVMTASEQHENSRQRRRAALAYQQTICWYRLPHCIS